jgi:serine/threonine protein kinase
MNSIPQAIGKYRIESELGRGASGTVFLAYDAFKEVHVAIKQVHAHLLADTSQAAKYRRLLHHEAVLANRLNHPHIVALIDVDEQAHQPYLVLEYVDGKPLSAFTSPDTLLPVAEVLNIVFKCCNALEYAQTEGLVHRDIKPANLLLPEDGEVKLTDFGTALQINSDATQMAGLVGSPSYMSPEQIREEKLTHHSDMFSLGVVLYELLTGQQPFRGETDYTTIFKINSETPTPVKVIRPELPSKLDGVISRVLSKRPQDRYATWRDFAEALVDVNRSLPRLPSQSTEAVRFQLLRGMAFFAEFSDVSIWETLRLGKIHAMHAGAVLMQEGVTGESFYILLEGSVAVTRNAWALSTLKEGVSIGEMVYLQPDNKVRTATVTAETEIAVLKIQGASLRRASAELQSCFDKAFIKILVTRLEASNRQLAEWDSP